MLFEKSTSPNPSAKTFELEKIIMKIITVTLAPAIDVTYALDKPVSDGLNRAKSFVLMAGGKGINVSRAILNAADGGDVNLLTVAAVGGASGGMFCDMLASEGMDVTRIPIAAPLRINVSAIPEDGEDCEINAPGAEMTADDLKTAEALILDAADAGDVVCICGSCPKGVAKSYPAQLCAMVKEKGAVCVIDCDGEALKLAAESDCPPDYIKPNAGELAKLCADLGIVCGTPAENARAVCEKTGGVTAVITTLGGDGSMITWNGGQFTAKSRKVKPVRIKGAGDTFLGTFVHAKFVAGMTNEEAVQCASDAATKYVEG